MSIYSPLFPSSEASDEVTLEHISGEAGIQAAARAALDGHKKGFFALLP